MQGGALEGKGAESQVPDLECGAGHWRQLQVCGWKGWHGRYAGGRRGGGGREFAGRGREGKGGWGEGVKSIGRGADHWSLLQGGCG